MLTRKAELRPKKALARKHPLRPKGTPRQRVLEDAKRMDQPKKRIREDLPKRARANQPRSKRPKATPQEQQHMDRVASMRCWACEKDGETQVSRTCLHHIRAGYGQRQKASNYEVIPLCEGHHQGMRDNTRTFTFHRSAKNFQLRYGTEVEILEAVYRRLGLTFDILLAMRGEEPPWWGTYLRGDHKSTLPPQTREALTGEKP